MKHFKLILLSALFVACCFTSCTNNEPVVDEQNINDSASITTSLAALRTQFNSQGNVIPTENPTGNIVFDFCFDFVYPLHLSYNNSTTVTVNNLDELIDVSINTTNNLYISGIEFPFNVEVYNEDQDAIIITTIANETQFATLIETCDFNTSSSCECYEIYDPVCVDITAPNGQTFVMTYPNACYAECDGFTEADFIENCQGDYNNPGGSNCFTFNFPLSIITDNGDTITVNSQAELDTILYNSYYFDFVYSFDVTLADGTLLSIGNQEAYIELLDSCNTNTDCELDLPSLEGLLTSCDLYEIVIFNQNGTLVDVNQVMYNANGNLIVNGEIAVTDLGTWSLDNSSNNLTLHMSGLLNFTLLNGNWDFLDCSTGNLIFSNGDYTINLACQDCICTGEAIPVCVEVDTGSGIEIITFVNECEAECAGYTQNDFVECENNTTNCSEQELNAILNECVWYVNTSLYQNVAPEFFIFNPDGSWSVGNPESNDTVTLGTWGTIQNPSKNQLAVSFGTDVEPYASIAALDWTVVVCSEEYVTLASNNQVIQLERDCN
ncbi:hypothetical protein [Psychroserpens damuponensis]|uniref:hypothetical protein n=1 Tax=Psychroserpens damuponensis TaxID=943936 RepID=UPI000ABB1930|nr:hypothetical protein [Psychroserpens damuponensis]